MKNDKLLKQENLECKQVWQWEDVKMKMSRCEHEKMWELEGVKMQTWTQTPQLQQNRAQTLRVQI